MNKYLLTILLNLSCISLYYAQTVTIPINSSLNDSYQLSDGSNNPNLVEQPGESRVYRGYRFTSLGIPAGAVITNAQLTIYYYDDGPGSLIVKAENLPNPAIYSNSSNHLLNRYNGTVTSNSVNWSIGSPSQDTELNSPNLSAVVQEVVNAQGSVNTMSFVLRTTSASPTFWNFDDGFSFLYPRLTITYTTVNVVSNNDTATATVGVANSNLVNVILNDTFYGVQATTANTDVNQVSSSNVGISINTNGIVSITNSVPAGTYTLTYRLCPAGATTNCNTATVTVNVTSVNNLPLAVADAITVNEDSGVTVINVTANDNFGGDGASIGTISLPSATSTNGGTLTINNNGTPNDPTDDEVNYTPAANFSGIDTFTYSITDADGDTSTATVTVTVNPNKDTDGDGILDSVDIDDDNDGILDVIENPGTNITTNEFNGTFGQLSSGTRDLQIAVANYNYAPISNSNGAGEYAVISFGTTNWHPGNLWENIRGHTTGNDDDAYLAVNGGTNQGTFYLETFTVQNNTLYEISFWALNAAPFTSIGDPNIGFYIKDSSNAIIFTQGTDPLSTPQTWVENTLQFDTGTNTQITLEIFNISTNSAGNDFAIDDISFGPVIPPTVDTDQDGIPDLRDLDSDNDGIPDNVEGQSTTSYIAPTGSVGVNGLYNVYENNDSASATSFAIVNTDSANDAIPDYLDLDSDNDGIFDIVESGSGLNQTNGRTNGTIGLNGLDNIIDSAGNNDSYNDPNGNINTPSTDLTDIDNDVNTTGDVDYRDNVINVITVDDAVTIDEDTTTSVNIFINDTNVPTSGTLTTTQPTNGTVVIIDPNNTPTDPSDNIVTYTPDANFSGTDTFTYTICDGNSICDTATVTMTVTEVDDLPVAVADTITVNEDSGVTSIDVTDNDDFGGDGPSTGTIALPSATSINGGTLTVNNNGTPNDPTDDEVNYTPATNFSGTDTFTYTIEDADGDTDTETVTVTVTEVDDLPVAVADAISVTENSAAISIDVTNNDDFGGDGPSTGTITLPSATSTNGGTLTVNNNGTPNNPTDDEVNYTPATLFRGTDTFTYTIEDADGDTDTETVTITVTQTTDADGDGILDSVDIDDDNDGILDVIENPGTNITNNEFNGTFGKLSSDTRDLQITVANYNYAPISNSNGAGEYAVISFGTTNWHPGDLWENIRGHTTGNDDDAYLAVNGGTNQGTFYLETFTVEPNTFYKVSFWALNAARFTAQSGVPDIGFNIKDSSNSIIFTQGTGLLSPHQTWIENTLQFDTGTNTQITLEIFNISTNSAGNDFAIDDISFGPVIPPTVDTDQDGIPDLRDLDSDNDGIPDNVEAQSTASYELPNNDTLQQYLDNNGLNSAYLSGLKPVDSDCDGIPDYLDSDSDNDGALDIDESFTTPPTGDVDINGLMSSAENNDNYTDVNGLAHNGTTFTLKDTDGDVPNGADYDYRDITTVVAAGTTIMTSLQQGAVTPILNDAWINIISNNKGVVITRVNGTAMITNPVEGMLIFDTLDTAGGGSGTFKVNIDGTTTGWRPLGW